MDAGGCHSPHIETSISICQELQQTFRTKAWNKSGANLLAVACYYAQVSQSMNKTEMKFELAANATLV